MVATSCAFVTALSTACAGVDGAKNRLLIRTLVSMTTRSRVIVGEQLVQAFLGESTGGGFSRDLVPEFKEGLDVSCPEALVVGHRKHDCDVAVLSANDDGFTLRLV